ncbi:hypothetical protein KKC97_02225 [bacterium]|nr:hypothetical protein [bacterium]MBU1636460.1 hypothetical protein [bacterium]
MTDFFFSKDRLLKLSRIRFIYAGAFALLFILTEVGRYIYRPFIYREGIYDFGVADTMGNSLGTLTQIFLYLALANPTKIQSYRIIGLVTIGYIVYEFAQPILPKGTFDWGDVFATLSAGLISLAIVKIFQLVSPDPESIL